MIVQKSKDTSDSAGKNATVKTGNEYRFEPIKKGELAGKDDNEDYEDYGDGADEEEDYSAFGDTSMGKSKKDAQSNMNKTTS